jgi:hypothetical protein
MTIGSGDERDITGHKNGHSRKKQRGKSES